MKKKVLAVFLSAAMIMGMAGCGSATKTSSTTKSSDSKNVKCTLTVWGPQEDQSDSKWLQTECEAFAKKHSNWDITFKYGVCSESNAKTNVTTDATAAADVYMFANDQIPDLVSANALSELGGDTVKAIKADNDKTTVNTVTYKKGIYGVPFTGNTWFMYYDKSKFTEDDVKNLDTMLSKGKVAFHRA